MNVTARMELLEKIGSTLQSKYTFAELHDYFAALKIAVPVEPPGQTFGSKRVFSKEALKSTPDDALLEIAEELGIKYSPCTRCGPCTAAKLERHNSISCFHKPRLER